MNGRARRILNSNISTLLGSLLILSFGIFELTIGFRIAHMLNPIADTINAHMGASQ